MDFLGVRRLCSGLESFPWAFVCHLTIFSPAYQECGKKRGQVEKETYHLGEERIVLLHILFPSGCEISISSLQEGGFLKRAQRQQ